MFTWGCVPSIEKEREAIACPRILYIITNCVCIRPSDNVLGAFSVAEPAIENYLSYFVLNKAGRPGQPLGGD
jgi:hypothetical protein